MKPFGSIQTSLCIAIFFWCASALPAQDVAPGARDDGSGSPLVDPANFFQQLFGGGAQEDREALAEVSVSLREERQLGDRALEAYLAGLRRQGIRIATRGRDVQYLRELVETVRPQMRRADRYREIRIYLADSPATDARSFPGGSLVFFRGMLEFAQSEAAPVGVVGHELSHLDHGHQLDHVRRIKLAQRTFRSGNVSPQRFFRTGGILMQMFLRPFRPEDEAQADRDGARWAYRAGYDPREMALMFRRMHRRDGDPPDGLPDFLRSHPYHLDRYETVLELYARLQAAEPKSDLYRGQENLKRRIPRSAKRFDDR